MKKERRINLHFLRRGTQLGMLVLMMIGAVSFSPAFFLLMFGIAVFFGPVFCGWLCPFGFIQELVGKTGTFLRKKLKIRVPELPYEIRYIRVGAALLVLAGMITGVFTFEGGSENSILFAAVLSGILILNLLWPRFFCRTLCPMGALLGLCNLIKIYPVRVQAFCTGCGKCDKACPMGVQPGKRGNNRDIGCISCMECCSACPVEGCLKVQSGRGKPKHDRPEGLPGEWKPAENKAE